MKPTKTWVLIADGARARILERDGPGHALQAIERLVFHGDHSATHDLVSDQQGRSFSSHGPGRSAIEPHSDPHRELKATFARALADVLARELAQHAFDRLIVVAAPVTLGDLRAAFSDPVSKMIVGEVAKDLTKLPNADVAAHLTHVLVT
jgi:protein required for attachment to host cells